MRVQYTQPKAVPANAKLLLDGYDASGATRGFTLRSDVGDFTTVTLDLVVLHGADLDLQGQVLIPAPVAALLVEFGWTPPPGAEERGGAIRLVRKGVPELDLLTLAEGKRCNCQGEWHGGEHTSDCPIMVG